jgi:hypothetical protein
MSERISSAIIILAPPYLRFRRENARLTIIKIPRVRIQRLGNDSKFDLLKLFALDAGSFGEPHLRFLEDLALKGVSTSKSQMQKMGYAYRFHDKLERDTMRSARLSVKAECVDCPFAVLHLKFFLGYPLGV